MEVAEANGEGDLLGVRWMQQAGALSCGEFRRACEECRGLAGGGAQSVRFCCHCLPLECHAQLLVEHLWPESPRELQEEKGASSRAVGRVPGPADGGWDVLARRHLTDVELGRARARRPYAEGGHALCWGYMSHRGCPYETACRYAHAVPRGGLIWETRALLACMGGPKGEPRVPRGTEG